MERFKFKAKLFLGEASLCPKFTQEHGQDIIARKHTTTDHGRDKILGRNYLALSNFVLSRKRPSYYSNGLHYKFAALDQKDQQPQQNKRKSFIYGAPKHAQNSSI
jgi:hypothetical protein